MIALRDLTTWKKFPPSREDLERLGRYRYCERLMTGEHFEAFTEIWPGFKRIENLSYVAVNFCGVVSKLCADLLFGEEPVYTAKVKDDANKEAQASLEEIVENNNLNTLCNTMALSSSYRGDCVFKVRWGELPMGSGNYQAIIESVPSDFYFREKHPNNVLASKADILAWIEKREENNREVSYLRREVHVPGRVFQELYRMKTENEIDRKVPLSTLSEFAGLVEEEETGYPGTLVIYTPNWRLDNSYWGISDYNDIKSLQYELNNRMTKNQSILDKHSSPKVVLPPGLLKQDDVDSNKLYLYKSELLDAIEISDPDAAGDLPKYLVWDAKLDAAFKEIEKIIEYMMMITETVPSAVGLSTDNSGGQSESGRALRFRLMRTLGKINRKKRFFVDSLEKALFAAQFLKNKYGGGPAPAPVVIKLRDGLPEDESENADIVNSRVTAGTMSRKMALVKYDGLRGEDLEGELNEIEKDKQSDAEMGTVANPEVAGGGTPELTNEQR